MKLNVEDTESTFHAVTSQDFDGYNQRTLYHVAVHFSMKHVNRAVIWCRCHERISRVKQCLTQCLGVISKRFKWSTRKIKIEPAQSSIDRSDHDMITTWMYGQTGDVFGGTCQLCDHLLTLKMVHSNILLGRKKEDGLAWMKSNTLCHSLDTSKWMLCSTFGKNVYLCLWMMCVCVFDSKDDSLKKRYVRPHVLTDSTRTDTL